MNRVLLAAAAACMIMPAAASAQSPTWPKTTLEVKAFVQDMPADAWTKVMAQSVSLRFFVGKPVVAIFNPYDEPKVSVVCDGKWGLVGNNAYNKDKGAPTEIPAHTVAFLPTDGFDGYCKSSIVGLLESGERHDGALNIPGDFTNSTAIFFAPVK